ncbi:MAG: hypothetical protein DHS20C02_16860 [Micavibrio sp.]|nr:MAG: hypothetical protein DHS20C02_16860 [Micavibrio sp.]
MATGKIFGIGWHKTATTSLQEALDILGFPGRHYPHEMYPEICAGQKNFKAADHYKSLTDFPVPLIFERLDQGYPGSKFILTVRDTEGWLKSVRKHFEIMSSPQKKFGGLSEHEFFNRKGVPNHQIHIYAYGQWAFDEDVFVKAYEAHNQKVRDYFKGRPDDLLVMDMEEGAGWEALCEFLDAPVPDQPYPEKFKTEQRLETFEGKAS